MGAHSWAQEAEACLGDWFAFRVGPQATLTRQPQLRCVASLEPAADLQRKLQLQQRPLSATRLC